MVIKSIQFIQTQDLEKGKVAGLSEEALSDYKEGMASN